MSASPNSVARVPADACFGCGACAARCPSACIALSEDREGFLHPTVDAAACTRCGACLAVCPAETALPPAGRSATPEAFAARHADAAVRRASTSGGLFTALAGRVLRAGGCVVGAAFDGGCTRVAHAVAERPEQLAPLTGTKYAQSDALPAFREMLRLLKAGRRVLFTGTPCQVAAARLLARDGAGLVTADLVCQAVPSPGLFRRYAAWLAARHGARTIRSFSFRDKSAEGWHRPALAATFDNGRRYRRFYEDDPFTTAFATGLAVRPCCHACPFRAFPRPGDLTLGDFWGVERVRPDLDDNTGTSLALAHSASGADLLQEAAADLALERVELAQGLAGNPCLSRSVARRPDNRAAFYDTLSRDGFDAAAQAFLTPRRPFSLRAWARHLLRRS